MGGKEDNLRNNLMKNFSNKLDQENSIHKKNYSLSPINNTTHIENSNSLSHDADRTDPSYVVVTRGAMNQNNKKKANSNNLSTDQVENSDKKKNMDGIDCDDDIECEQLD